MMVYELMRKYRAWTGFTQKQLGGVLGVSRLTITRSESDKSLGNNRLINKILKMEGWEFGEFILKGSIGFNEEVL